jgi:hypothetical protein
MFLLCPRRRTRKLRHWLGMRSTPLKLIQWLRWLHLVFIRPSIILRGLRIPRLGAHRRTRRSVPGMPTDHRRLVDM